MGLSRDIAFAPRWLLDHGGTTRPIRIGSFGSVDDGELEQRMDLTIFGENNDGKSNAIDAIRLLTQPLGWRWEIYCKPTDIRFQSRKSDFDLEAHFADPDAGQQGRLISVATDATSTEARSAALAVVSDLTRYDIPVQC